MKNRTFVAAFSALCVLASCCTLPNVDNEAGPPEAGPPKIKTVTGEMPPGKSEAAIRKIERETGATDIVKRQVKLMEEVSGKPLFADNKATLLRGGAEADAAMQAAIRSAKDTVDLESFEFGDQQFADLLLQKRAEGVQVNVIYDSVGSMHTPAALFQRMKAGGVNVLEYNPINPLKVRRKWLLNRRDHRKILVVDGKIAFTGGINISNVYTGSGSGEKGSAAARPWRDTDVMIQGPAVAEFQRLFLGTWKWQNGPALPQRDYFPPLGKQGDDYVMVVGSRPGEQNRLTYLMYYTAFANAANHIHLTSAYFVPDKETIAALTDAARRGVDVTLILPGMSDVPLAFHAGRSYYTELLSAGVRIYERKGEVLHAKTAVIDGVWSTVGSTNMDMWSFASNNEINAVVLGKDFGDKMEAMFEDDLKNSQEVTLKQWQERPVIERLRDSFARMFECWL